MGTINYLQAIKPDTAYIRKIINSSLLFDWVISIEYQDAESESGDWKLWEQTFFALRCADAVLESLMTCYTNHPQRTIRINAEKIRPQSQFLLTVYNPGYIQSETQSKPGDTRTWLQRERPSSTSQADLIS